MKLIIESSPQGFTLSTEQQETGENPEAQAQGGELSEQPSTEQGQSFNDLQSLLIAVGKLLTQEQKAQGAGAEPSPFDQGVQATMPTA
jgi:hypothetical protein